MAASSSSSSSSGFVQPVSVGRVDVEGGPAMLPPALETDSILKKELQPKLIQIKHIVGDDKFNECLNFLHHSMQMAEMSLISAGFAFSAIALPAKRRKELSPEDKGKWKAAQLPLRDLILWRTKSVALSYDKTTFMELFMSLKKEALGDDEFFSKLSKSYTKMMKMIYPQASACAPHEATANAPHEAAAREDDLISQLTNVVDKIMGQLKKHIKDTGSHMPCVQMMSQSVVLTPLLTQCDSLQKDQGNSEANDRCQKKTICKKAVQGAKKKPSARKLGATAQSARRCRALKRENAKYKRDNALLIQENTKYKHENEMYKQLLKTLDRGTNTVDDAIQVACCCSSLLFYFLSVGCWCFYNNTQSLSIVFCCDKQWQGGAKLCSKK